MNIELLTEVVKWLYPISSSITIAFYLPQIWIALKEKSAMREVSLLSWGAWGTCAMVSTSYCFLVAKDNMLVFFHFLSATSCLIVFFLVFYKRFFRYKT